MGSAVVCSRETTDRCCRRTVRVSWMDLWQSNVKQTCTAECRQRIHGSRDQYAKHEGNLLTTFKVAQRWNVHGKEQPSEHTALWHAWCTVGWWWTLGTYGDVLCPTRDERMEPVKCTAADSKIGTETFKEDVVVNEVECSQNVQWQQISHLSIARWRDNVVDDLQQRRFSRMSKTVSRLTLAEPSCRHYMWPQAMHRQLLEYLGYRPQVKWSACSSPCQTGQVLTSSATVWHDLV